MAGCRDSRQEDSVPETTAQHSQILGQVKAEAWCGQCPGVERLKPGKEETEKMLEAVSVPVYSYPTKGREGPGIEWAGGGRTFSRVERGYVFLSVAEGPDGKERLAVLK